MNQLTEKHTFRISKQQKETLIILAKYDVKVDWFIREAIKEKIKRDWKCIKEKKERVFLPF